MEGLYRVVISALKMEMVCISETLVLTYEATQRKNPKNANIILANVKTSDLTN
jgi:hypothetical protein